MASRMPDHKVEKTTEKARDNSPTTESPRPVSSPENDNPRASASYSAPKIIRLEKPKTQPDEGKTGKTQKIDHAQGRGNSSGGVEICKQDAEMKSENQRYGALV